MQLKTQIFFEKVLPVGAQSVEQEEPTIDEIKDNEAAKDSRG
jgi:hypothetical protein